MGILDKPLTNIVQRVLSSVGGTCVLKSVNLGNFDPRTDQQNGGSNQSWTVPCSPPYPFDQSLIDNNVVQEGDFKLIVTTSAVSGGLVPTIHMTVKRNNREYGIVKVSPINSGDADVCYELHCRG